MEAVPDEYLAAREAAARGETPTVKIGRRVLVPRAALYRLVGAEAACGVLSATSAILGQHRVQHAADGKEPEHHERVPLAHRNLPIGSANLYSATDFNHDDSIAAAIPHGVPPTRVTGPLSALSGSLLGVAQEVVVGSSRCPRESIICPRGSADRRTQRQHLY